MLNARAPTDTERQVFIERLVRFRASLSASKQQMLDALVAAGRQAHERGDAEVYWLAGAVGSGATAADVWAPYTRTTTEPGMTEPF